MGVELVGRHREADVRKLHRFFELVSEAERDQRVVGPGVEDVEVLDVAIVRAGLRLVSLDQRLHQLRAAEHRVVRFPAERHVGD